MNIPLELVPWGVTIFTLLGTAFALGARLAQIETNQKAERERVDLLYEVYVRDKLKTHETDGKAVHQSPWRLTPKGSATLNPALRESICEGPRGSIADSMVYIGHHPDLKKATEDDATRAGLAWGDVLVLYALWATDESTCTEPQALPRPLIPRYWLWWSLAWGLAGFCAWLISGLILVPFLAVAVPYTLEIGLLIMVLWQIQRVRLQFPTTEALQRRRNALSVLVMALTIEATWFGVANVGLALGFETAWMKETIWFLLFKGFGVTGAAILAYFFFVDRP